jgi:hypothetical protein
MGHGHSNSVYDGTAGKKKRGSDNNSLSQDRFTAYSDRYGNDTIFSLF